jgi:hypothetical protein
VKLNIIVMGVTVREKVKGSGVWWIFVNHNERKIIIVVALSDLGEKWRITNDTVSFY